MFDEEPRLEILVIHDKLCLMRNRVFVKLIMSTEIYKEASYLFILASLYVCIKGVFV
jgi:hypothetical protein